MYTVSVAGRKATKQEWKLAGGGLKGQKFPAQKDSERGSQRVQKDSLSPHLSAPTRCPSSPPLPGRWEKKLGKPSCRQSICGVTIST